MSSQPVLSQTQLLAMPDEAYMSQAQLTFFKRTLETELALLQENMRQTSEHLSLQQETPDPADRATQEENHSLELRARTVNASTLKPSMLHCGGLRKAATVIVKKPGRKLACKDYWHGLPPDYA